MKKFKLLIIANKLSTMLISDTGIEVQFELSLSY